MAIFLTTKAIASELEMIIRKAEKEVFILTPYLKLSSTFYERIEEAIEKGVKCTIIYGKTELQKSEQKLLYDLNCDILFKADMHGKCYANEHTALITSMNLHAFSEANNREFGVLLNKRTDRTAFEDCLSEITSIVGRAELKKQNDNKVVGKATANETSYDYAKVREEWYRSLSESYSNYNFIVKDNIMYCSPFLSTKIDFSTKYGFAMFTFKGDRYFLKDKRERYLEPLRITLRDYSVFWNQYNQICLYSSKDITFISVEEEVRYYARGLKEFYSAIVKYGII